MKILALAVVAAALAVPAIAPATTYVVSVFEYGFDPDPLAINVGDTVTWSNDGTLPHTSTSDTAVWNSGVLSPGDTYDYTFTAAGVFPYHCAVHPTLMRGTITVDPGTPVEPKTWGSIKALFR